MAKDPPKPTGNVKTDDQGILVDQLESPKAKGIFLQLLILISLHLLLMLVCGKRYMDSLQNLGNKPPAQQDDKQHNKQKKN